MSEDSSLNSTEIEKLSNIAETCIWEQIATEDKARIDQAIAPDTSPPVAIVYPKTTQELAEVMTLASDRSWQVLPCGNGSKISWGGLVHPVKIAIATTKLNHLIEHAIGDLTVTVEAGIKFSDLQKQLATANQFLPLDPAYPETATIGGIIATADTGSLRHRYGGVRDLLIGFSFVRADGKIAKAGGRVVKNVAGYDLMKLFTGSYGTLGIISQVTFRVYPLPPASTTVLLSGEKEGIDQALRAVVASALTPTSLDLISPNLSTQLGFAKQMGLILRFQSIPASVQQQAAITLEISQKLGLKGLNLESQDEANLWHRLPQQIWNNADGTATIAKIGVKPAKAVEAIASHASIGLIHAGKGIGLLRFTDAERLSTMRDNCENQGGFLTLLEAPATVKHKIDAWGSDRSNSINLMRIIKQKFDPQHLLNPHRFIGGI
ncbi:FAD-binding oxidoreductase [Merismopedia glauca]|uniref:FAD-binding oxidoreductase n=1 Tax=Merismopedia glauca CCAP 1448/3 TaxID=1296344 RepID=A0A2T1C1T1_9CYAN|nr:FAD-binding oxidoreductase [Merismopedia glauca]PSB02221.1 FAD-binding oxidoreductase [Merismopedia glauca CCAP 1448/3]